MYGLLSRESLTKRQSRWVQEVDESVRSNPAQRSLNQTLSSNNPNKGSIITLGDQEIISGSRSDSMRILSSNSRYVNLMDNQIVSTDEDLYELYNELKQKYDTLEEKYNSLRSITDSGPNHNINNLVSRIQRLEKSNDIDHLRKRVDTLESSFSSNSNIRKSSDNTSEFSCLTDVDLATVPPGIREFVPYFIKEEYAGRDNNTKLKDLQFEITVELLGFYSDVPIIYPFGSQKDLPKFRELTLDMNFQNVDETIKGTAYGIFKRGRNGIYTIKLAELCSDGEASGIEKYTLPLIFTCSAELIPE